MPYNDFTKLKIWQEAHALTLEVYRLSRSFPNDERFGLTSQLRRAAVSVEANIAEGTGRKSPEDFARFLAIARGSAHETVSHCLISRDLNFISSEAAREVIGRYKGLSAGIYACGEALTGRRR